MNKNSKICEKMARNFKKFWKNFFRNFPIFQMFSHFSVLTVSLIFPNFLIQFFPPKNSQIVETTMIPSLTTSWYCAPSCVICQTMSAQVSI